MVHLLASYGCRCPWLVLLAGPSGGGCWYKAKCEMLLRKIDGEMNVQNCGFSAKGRRWQHATRLTATAVITDSRHRFSKRWHVADVKHMAGDEQTTLMVHRNFKNLACTFRIYVCLRLCDRECCSSADGSGSCHAPAPSYFKEMTRCDIKNFTGDDQATLTVDRKSAI